MNRGYEKGITGRNFAAADRVALKAGQAAIRANVVRQIAEALEAGNVSLAAVLAKRVGMRLEARNPAATS